MRDYGYEAQQAAEAHLRAIFEYDEHQEMHDLGECSCGDLGDGPDTAGPWCGGCDTCVIRETLHAAWPILLEAACEETKSPG